MKVLRCDLRYELPDEWTGNAADALREVARFLDDTTAGVDVLPTDAVFGASNHAFWYGTQRAIRFNGEVSVYEAEPPRWHWQRIDTAYGMARVHSYAERLMK